jgi:hypothetical protein
MNITGNNDRIVYRREDSKWVNKKLDAEKASSLHDTQISAEQSAREILKNSGGGELITKGIDGKIRSKDTIPPAKDSFPPRDKEH